MADGPVSPEGEVEDEEDPDVAREGDKEASSPKDASREAMGLSPATAVLDKTSAP